MKSEILQKIRDLGLLAVIRAPGPEKAMEIVAALVQGGVTGIEITYTTPDADRVVQQLHQKYGHQIVLGMGTVTEPHQADAAAQASAQFLVSPHTDKELAAAMVKTGLPVMLGALTPSEIVQAQKLGASVVKLFPGSLTGPSYVKALRGPYPQISIMPTGGVNIENIKDWFAAGVFAVGVGSALFPKSWVEAGRYAEISERARQYRDEVRRSRGLA